MYMVGTQTRPSLPSTHEVAIQCNLIIPTTDLHMSNEVIYPPPLITSTPVKNSCSLSDIEDEVMSENSNEL